MSSLVEVKMTALGRLIFLLSFFLAWPGEMNVFLAHPDGTHQMLLSEVIFFSHKNQQLKLTLFFFLLVSRNCGNVFCSSCCNQKVPVPSQQLFEPSRVCKSCYSSLHPTSSSIDLELDKPIAATSN
jgi:hypothetical protein